MEVAILAPKIAIEKLEFLMEIQYLVEQIAKAHIPLDEGYEKLQALIQEVPKK